MSKHTPGPWIVQGPYDAPWVATADYRTILPSTVADARLIAAAPDMLAALEALLRTWDHESYPWEMVHAAIAKAKGQ